MRKIILPTLLALAIGPLSAREWRDRAGTSKFEAEYVSHDGKSVTLRKAGRIVTFSVEKLSEADKRWLLTNHPRETRDEGGAATPAAAPKGAAFDTLCFGDTREEVSDKLKSSTMVDGSIAEVMLARVGPNGVYRTKQTIGGLHCHLYFDWDSSNRLKEVTLRTKAMPADSYGGVLKSNWTEMIELLTVLHGAPINTAPYPDSDDLQDGAMLNSHLWRTEDGHSVLLGTGQEGKQYTVNVRITTDRIEPVVSPE